MEARKSWLKKSIVVLLAGVLVYFSVLFIYRYLNQGLLVVNVEANNPTIFIKNKAGKEIARESSKSLDVKLDKGSYTVEALDSNGGITSSFVDIKARATTSLKLSVSSPKIPQKIKDISALDIAETNSGLMLVQGNSQLLQKIDLTSGVLSSDHVNIPQVKKIEVDDRGNGYLLTYRNLIHRLDGSKNSNIRETVLKNAGELATPRDIEYHPESGKLFISAGNKIYLLDRGETTAKLFAETPWAVSRISYNGGDWLSVAEHAVNTEETSQEEGEPLIVELRLALLNINTKELVEIDKNIALKSEIMSPDGNHLAYYKDASLVIHDVNKKETVTKIPLVGISSPEISWCSDKVVLYSDNTGVWLHEVGGSSSRSLISKQSNVMALECKGDIAYIGTFIYPHTGMIYKVSLSDNNDELASKLSSTLPYKGSTVIVDYVYTKIKPTVNVRILLPKNLYNLRSGDAGYLSAEIFKEQAKKEARQYLKDNGINLNEVKIVYELG